MSMDSLALHPVQLAAPLVAWCCGLLSLATTISALRESLANHSKFEVDFGNKLIRHSMKEMLASSLTACMPAPSEWLKHLRNVQKD